MRSHIAFLYPGPVNLKPRSTGYSVYPRHPHGPRTIHSAHGFKSSPLRSAMICAADRSAAPTCSVKFLASPMRSSSFHGAPPPPIGTLIYCSTSSAGCASSGSSLFKLHCTYFEKLRQSHPHSSHFKDLACLIFSTLTSTANSCDCDNCDHCDPCDYCEHLRTTAPAVSIKRADERRS